MLVRGIPRSVRSDPRFRLLLPPLSQKVDRNRSEPLDGTPKSVEVSKLAREGRFDYLLVESTGISEPLPVAGPRLGRRTALTLPLFPPPQ